MKFSHAIVPVCIWSCCTSVQLEWAASSEHVLNTSAIAKKRFKTFLASDLKHSRAWNMARRNFSEFHDKNITCPLHLPTWGSWSRCLSSHAGSGHVGCCIATFSATYGDQSSGHRSICSICFNNEWTICSWYLLIPMCQPSCSQNWCPQITWDPRKFLKITNDSSKSA